MGKDFATDMKTLRKFEANMKALSTKAEAKAKDPEAEKELAAKVKACVSTAKDFVKLGVSLGSTLLKLLKACK